MSAKDELGSGTKKSATVNAAAIKGEPGTGFEKAGDLGEFECGNCEYFDAKASACSQKDMKKKSKQPRLKDGRVSVNAEDCCEYVSRIGRKDKDEE
jgi:hypothetical protein